MSDSDPDNYSINEMMQRLKSPGEETKEGERRLVTRPDGTQVVKVKRRKRRSKQPHKEEEAKRRRRTLIMVSVITALVMLLGLGGIGWVVYLNSANYRNGVVARISEWSGAEVDVVAFRATPVGAGADSLLFTWPEDCPAAQLKVNFASANLMLTSHVTGVWTGQHINAGSGELIIRDVPSGDALGIPSGTVPFQMPMRINQMNIKFGEGTRVPFAIYRTAGSLAIPNPEQPEPNIVIQGGECRIGRWGKFNVNYASLRLGRNGTSLGTLQLSPENEPASELVLSGEGLAPLPVRGGEAELRLEVREMPSFALLGSGLGALIEGTFESPAEDKDRPGVSRSVGNR